MARERLGFFNVLILDATCLQFAICNSFEKIW